ncbi:MAG: class I tRNA ligase family protein [Candidatus Rehaiarchaeum fermentans]|nr:class I tRNA ligase family protein [Candidatus Rehaiarchaeum fermentans]MCW1297054.1 class I tRNA ligase family protein [Candidatus Rehaiarchaeum fermentans]MCW1302424.1 class I tRNA ligase family protein [Candidatus Rehaiarchaeum fermentans]
MEISNDLNYIEDYILKKRKNQAYDIDPNNPNFIVIDTAPPYVDGELHMGHALEYTIDDIIARIKRLESYNVIFPLGVDRNGLPVEIHAEKEFGISMEKTSREEFIEKCKILLDKSQEKAINDWKRLGISFNHYEFGNELGYAYQTDSPEYRALTQSIFIYLWNKGLIYESDKVINYCPVCRTAISNSEVEYKTKETELVYFKAGDYLIATTRPELIFACRAVAVNPHDERYKNIEYVEMPLINEKVRVIKDEIIDPNFGTGMMMVCSYGDRNDIFLFKKYGLDQKIIINKEGKMINTGIVDGLTIAQARDKVIQLLKDKGLLIKTEKIITEKPTCWRSKNEIEFLPEKELYLRQVEFKNLILEKAKDCLIKEDVSKNLFINWVNNIDEDWPISRTRYYGTEVPLWKCKKCNNYLVPPPGKYYKPWKEKFFEKCPFCGSEEIEGDTRTLDTWMDSSNTPFFISKYNTEMFKKLYPVFVRVQGRDIIRTWMYFTMLKGVLLTNSSPIKNWLIHFYVNINGEKMSKSKGNGITLEKAIEMAGGADVLRLWVVSGVDVFKSDVDFSTRDPKNMIAAKRFINKIINLARFVSQFKEVEKSENEFTKLFVDHFNFVKNKVIDLYDSFEFFEAFRTLKSFIIDVFADHLIELSKKYVYSNNNAFIYAIHYILKDSLLLLHPIIPFTTDYLYEKMYNKDITKEKITKHDIAKNNEETITKIMKIDSYIWNLKKNKKIALNLPISKEEIKLSEDLIPIFNKYKEIFVKGHNIEGYES